MTIRIGTRGSALALYQARTVAALLGAQGGVTCEIVVIKTSGDRLAEAPLSEVGGKRLFVKEIEDALLAGTVDVAVHSSKDMPADLPPGLSIAAVLERADPRDAIILPASRLTPPASFTDIAASLAPDARIGTSSVRRSAQLRRVFPSASFIPIRGNVDTRLRKLDDGQCDLLVMAAAGLNRLEYGGRISAVVPIEVCVPAPGQGIIAVETRADDRRTCDVVAAIDHAGTRARLDAERALVRGLGGGCQMPIGGFADIGPAGLAITGMVSSLDGDRSVRARAEGRPDEAAAVGADLARQLLDLGAGDLLAEAAGGRPLVPPRP
jgi:hydroxymethylbilane synthase